jgi:2-polyprenyl-3-methyl-5-hydroxy-6-metoxy-1,4-benzoquinol methylase
MTALKTFDPAVLLGDRLGLTLYGIFAEDHLSNRTSKAKMLYEQFVRYFPGERGIYAPAHFAALIDSIRSEGFSPYNPIFANPEEFALMNGSHRAATAIQLGISSVPYVLRYNDDRVDESIFSDILGRDAFQFLKAKQAEYIARCDELTALRCRIRMIMREHPASFQTSFSSVTRVPALRCYQGFERLGILGKRPAEARIATYRLAEFLNTSMRVLDIGCNVGFGSLILSQHVASVDGFDVDPAYIGVSSLVRDYLGVTNCSFSTRSLIDFHPDVPYDCVVATAVHGWSGLSFGDYVKKLVSWTAPEGIMLIESHELDAEFDWRQKKAFFETYFDILHHGFIDDVDTRQYQSEYREFLLLRKRPKVDYSKLQFSTELSMSAVPKIIPDQNRCILEVGQRVLSTGSAFVRACGAFTLCALPAGLALHIRSLVNRRYQAP